MRTRPLVVAALVALSTPAPAGTKVQMNLVPTPPDCFGGPYYCKNGFTPVGGCTVDSDCDATLSPSSKFKIDGKLIVKGTLTGVVDTDGARVSTDPADPTDDFTLKLTLSRCIANSGLDDICTPNTIDVYIKVDLKNGKGKIEGDVSGALATDPTGTAIAIRGGGVAKMANPGGCPGDNSAAGIAGRVNTSDCSNGLFLAVPGFQKEI